MDERLRRLSGLPLGFTSFDDPKFKLFCDSPPKRKRSGKKKAPKPRKKKFDMAELLGVTDEVTSAGQNRKKPGPKPNRKKTGNKKKTTAGKKVKTKRQNKQHKPKIDPHEFA